MLTWIVNNIATIIICAVLAVIVAAVVIKMVKDKRAGKSGCGCGCGSCPMSSSCHSSKPKS
ncbi:MAG: FeoB-associated Cys-rich membrane protein [Clostridiales bacterium]|nr:FeoB-associated Cys-rich membrane protein [Clostridiales bacterium]